MAPMVRITSRLGLVVALLATSLAHADSLLEVYQLARQNDPQVREADANRLAVREARPQARGALLPQVDASAGKDWVSNDGSNVFAQAIDDDGNPATPPQVVLANRQFDGRSSTEQWRVDLTQTLFRWDQWVRFRQADKQVLQADVDYQIADMDLYIRVSEAYFNVLAAEDTLTSNVAAREAIGRQLEQAQKRFEVGLIAITDVQEAQAGFDQAVAAEILAKRQLATNKEVLREIIGDYPGDLSKPRSEIPLVSPNPADDNQWVELALQQNLSLQSAQLGADIARDNIRIARSGHFPTVDFVASHSDVDSDAKQKTLLNMQGQPSGSLNDQVRQPTDFETSQDSFGLQFKVPLFSGGATSSETRQAVYEHRAAKERLERTARQTERQTRDAYLAVTSEISRVRALQQALKSAQTALQATEAGFEVGTRTTVDVLESRRQLFQAETNFARSRYDYIVNVLKLKQAAGTLNKDDVQEVDSWLEPVSAAQ
ncbi:MAG: TolC family outer membrane protein [Gammaproteobacteria bacterium]|nr:MAG: TolC family outer membrane protein [Gammaproteobacteria bacterium]